MHLKELLQVESKIGVAIQTAILHTLVVFLLTLFYRTRRIARIQGRPLRVRLRLVIALLLLELSKLFQGEMALVGLMATNIPPLFTAVSQAAQSQS